MSTTKFLVEGVYETTCDRCGVPRPHGPDWLEWAQLNLYKHGAMGPPPGTVDLCPSCLGILEQLLAGASL
jgi:hypothetical protein